MGRKDYRQQPQRGPGPKARRQKDPKLPPALLQDAAIAKVGGGGGVDGKKLTSRQKQRLKRRLVKLSGSGALLAASKKNGSKGKVEPASEKLPIEDEDDGEELDDDDAANKHKKLRLDLEPDDEDGEDGGLLDPDDEDYLNDEFPVDEEEEEDDSDGAEEEDKDKKVALTGEDDDQEDAGSSSGDEGQEKKTDKKQQQQLAPPDQTDPADLSELDGRIDDLLQSLNSQKTQKGQKVANRSELVDKLCDLLCTRFSYNAFLMRKLIDLYPKDILDFLQSNEVDRPLTLRVNALKTRRKDLAQSLIARGVNLDPFDKWSKVGLVVYDSQVPLGATPEYLAGHYMLQGAASMLPVMALDPKPQEKVLDLCAAPGGKTTYLAELMRNTGLVMANEANRERAKAVVGNAHRHGLNNIVVCVGDGREFARTMHNFDRVLVDAPCTGTGVIAKDPAVKVNKEEKDVLKCSHLQKQLLLAGIDSAKVGGTVVYCTCSILVEENEAVVEYALRRRGVKIVDSGLQIGEAGFRSFKGKQFHPSLSLAKRITPHQHNMDGFFLVKLVKHAQGGKATPAAAAAAVAEAEADEVVMDSPKGKRGVKGDQRKNGK